MADDLSALETWATPLLEALTGPERRRLAREVGQALRRSQQARIAAQQNPDGSDYAPRKAQATTKARQAKGRIRRAMFTKLRTARFLRILLDEEGVSVGFSGTAARIATVHQEGGRDTPRPGARSIRYEARVLLGLTEDDRQMIADLILKHAQGAS